MCYLGVNLLSPACTSYGGADAGIGGAMKGRPDRLSGHGRGWPPSVLCAGIFRKEIEEVLSTAPLL